MQGGVWTFIENLLNTELKTQELGPVYMRPGRSQTGMKIEIVNTFKVTFHSRILSVDWIGTDKNIFLCLVRSGLELMTLTKRNIFLFLAIHGYFS